MKYKLLTFLLNTPGLEIFVIAAVTPSKLKRYKKKETNPASQKYRYVSAKDNSV
jgi:hypothetical protein